MEKTKWSKVHSWYTPPYLKITPISQYRFVNNTDKIIFQVKYLINEKVFNLSGISTN